MRTEVSSDRSSALKVPLASTAKCSLRAAFGVLNGVPAELSVGL